MIWYVLKVAPPHELRLARELRTGLGLETYVPIERVEAVRLGKRFERRKPLVPTYLFAGAHEAMPWRAIAETRHVRGWLETAGAPAIVTERELAHIRRMEAELNRRLAEGPRRLRPGDRVRIRVGPWSSIESLITSVRGAEATLEVRMLNSTRLIRAGLDTLEPAA